MQRPAGLAAPCNYLKHAKAWGPSALRRAARRAAFDAVVVFERP